MPTVRDQQYIEALKNIPVDFWPYIMGRSRSQKLQARISGDSELSGILDTFSNIGSGISSGFQATGSAISNFAGGTWDVIGDVGSATWDLTSSAGTTVGGWLGDAGGAVVDFGRGVGDFLTRPFQDDISVPDAPSGTTPAVSGDQVIQPSAGFKNLQDLKSQVGGTENFWSRAAGTVTDLVKTVGAPLAKEYIKLSLQREIQQDIVESQVSQGRTVSEARTIAQTQTDAEAKRRYGKILAYVTRHWDQFKNRFDTKEQAATALYYNNNGSVIPENTSPQVALQIATKGQQDQSITTDVTSFVEQNILYLAGGGLLLILLMRNR